MAAANPLWGAPRLHGELRKLGIEISERTVSRLLAQLSRPPSQPWRTFLANHLSALVSMDFLTVSTLTGRVLFVLVLISHNRRRIVHINCTERPTSTWTAQQLVDAFPEDSAPRYLLRDRDSIYDDPVRRRIASLGITEVVSSPLSPWQNPYLERVIGSIRRECLDHVIILNQRHLRRMLRAYLSYYHRSRTHLALGKDAPESRPASAGAGTNRGDAGSGRLASPLRPSGSVGHRVVAARDTGTRRQLRLLRRFAFRNPMAARRESAVRRSTSAA
jgi:transposase InsO family protein